MLQIFTKQHVGCTNFPCVWVWVKTQLLEVIQQHNTYMCLSPSSFLTQQHLICILIIVTFHKIAERAFSHLRARSIFQKNATQVFISDQGSEKLGLSLGLLHT